MVVDGTATPAAEPKPQAAAPQPTTGAAQPPKVQPAVTTTSNVAPPAKPAPALASSRPQPSPIPAPTPTPALSKTTPAASASAAVPSAINKPIPKAPTAPAAAPAPKPGPGPASVAVAQQQAAAKAAAAVAAAARANQAKAKAAAHAAAAAHAVASSTTSASASASSSRHTSREHKPSAKKRASPPPPQVTMATAATATTSSSAKGGENTGRWTAEEHRLFLQGLEQHGKGWKKIASLIKSRTVVQIRTHAQKYFQKLAKARQNGEEGEIAMDGRGPGGTHLGGPISHGAAGSAANKRRRAASGTKRRSISSVVASAQREAKKQQQAAATVSATSTPISTPPIQIPVAPALAPYVAHPMPPQGQQVGAPVHAQPQAQPQSTTQIPSITTAHGTISGAALEDSLFRFLTPVGGETVYNPPPQSSAPSAAPQVNDVARKAGANPIVLPAESQPGVQNNNAANSFLGGGDISPTGVTDLWIESKDAPTWYASGQDVDELLHEADALDWLADTGDLHETYVAPVSITSEKDAASLCSELTGGSIEVTNPNPPIVKRAEPSNGDITKEVMPPIPSTGMFSSTEIADSTTAEGVSASNAATAEDDEPPLKKQKVGSSVVDSSSTASLFASATEAANATGVDHHLDVFDAHLDEQAFVSALLDNNGESTASFPTIH